MSTGFLSTLVIGNTAYSSSGVAYSGFAGAGGTATWASRGLFGLRFTGDDEAYSGIEFNVIGCGPGMPLAPGVQVQLVVSYSDGTSPSIKFTGDLQRPQKRDSEQGPIWGYSATDLKKRADYVTLLSSSGLAVASYNLSPTDPLYLFALAGKTVGQIVTDVLQSPSNAAVLNGLGVGQYSVSLGVYTLPSATVTDLAALSIVPPISVQLSGEGILNILEAFIQKWMAQYTLYVQPDGTIRVISIFGRTAHSFTQPSGSGGDPVDNLYYDINVTGCYAAVQIIGQDIAGTTLSFADGTLKRSTTAPQLAAWTSASFNTAQNSNDQGTASSVTSSNCTVHSDQATTFWAANFLNNNGGVIVLYNLATTGVAITEVRQITSCTALSPGGTATVGWDSTLPLDTTSYTRYRIYTTNTQPNLVDRSFFVCEPSTGHTGLNTYIGSHLYPIFPFGYAWGGLGKGATQISTITQPSAKVLWSPTGAYPWFEAPIGVKLDPSTGTVILDQPAVFLSAGFAGQVGSLANGYPSSFFMGLWYDVQVAVPYNRGQVNTRYPATGFAGTANSAFGITRVKTIALPNYIWKGDTIALNALAQQHLLVVQDAVVTGTLRVHFDSYFTSYPSPFDPLTIGYAIQVVTPGAASPIDGLTLPVRSFCMEWPNDGADIHLLTFTFSNQHRQFEGDELYIHPAFSSQGWGVQSDQLFSSGIGSMASGIPMTSDEGSSSLGSGIDMGGMGSGMAGREVRQRRLREGNGPLPNTAWSAHDPNLPVGGSFEQTKPGAREAAQKQAAARNSLAAAEKPKRDSGPESPQNIPAVPFSPPSFDGGGSP
jgi:hypothetical protein